MTHDRTQSAAMTAFTTYMTRHGLRKTPERYAIFECLLDMPRHFSVDELHAQMDTAGYHVSRATIYNTVNMLVDAGLVRRHNFGNTTSQYEKSTGPAAHHHLVCTECGKIREIVDADIDAAVAQRSFRGFTPLYTELSIYGICRQCQRMLKNSKDR